MTVKPRVLALVTEAFGGRGGIAQYNRDFITALVESGAVAKVSVFPRQAPDPIGALPAGIEQEPPRFGRIHYSFTAVNAALIRSFDVIFCGHLHMAPLGALIAHLSHAQLVVQMHGIEAWQRPDRVRRMAVESADLILSVSRYTRARVLSWAAIAPERVMVVSNIVREAFTPGDAQALRKEWALDGKRVLLSVGRIDQRERYKGHDLVIKAIPYLVGQGHDVVYVILGEGNDIPRLKALASELCVADRVRFMGTPDLDRLVDAYRMADVFTMPSTGEGFGIVFLEAMACGTPAIGLAVAGARDALVDGKLGHAVSESDFCGTLSRLLGEPRPNSQALARAVRRRFGRGSMLQGARAVLDRVRELHEPSVAHLGDGSVHQVPEMEYATPKGHGTSITL